MPILSVLGSLQRFSEWLLELRGVVYIITSIVAAARLSVLWITSSNKKEALSETVSWITGLVIGILGVEVVKELLTKLK